MSAWTRRRWLQGVAGLGVGGRALGAAATEGARDAGAAADGAKGPLFAPERQRALEAAMERLLPGALAAGVPAYLAYWLVQEPYQGVRRYLKIGALQLDRVAQQRHKKRFADLDDAAQDAVLGEFQAGAVKAKGFDGSRFFQQLFELVLEGFLSDPRYGGNRDRVGWKFVGQPDGLRSCWWSPKGVRRVLHPTGDLDGDPARGAGDVTPEPAAEAAAPAVDDDPEAR